MKETHPILWVKTNERLPEDEKNVPALIRYNIQTKSGPVMSTDIAIMYRRNGSWYFNGSNAEYHGKYIEKWLDIPPETL